MICFSVGDTILYVADHFVQQRRDPLSQFCLKEKASMADAHKKNNYQYKIAQHPHMYKFTILGSARDKER